MTKIFKREKYLQKIAKQLEDLSTILFLIWPRQSWKTTLLNSLIEFGYIARQHTIFLNWETLFSEWIWDYKSFYEHLQINFDLKNTKFLIIDEAQILPNIWLILKILIDKIRNKELNFKIIVSWSWSLNVFKWISDSLVWRKKIIYVWPFDFEEFVQIKWKKLIKDIQSTVAINQYLQLFYKEFAIFWWYPKVILAKTLQEKVEALLDIIKSYLEKDIKLLLNEKEFLNFPKFFKSLANKIWSQINISQICEESWIPRYIAEKYLYILENSFMIKSVSSLNTWKFKWEIKKKEKIYFTDLWILSYFLGVSKINSFVKWPFIENFVLTEILKNKNSNENIYFWWTYNKSEIDFILKEELTNKLKLIEVKSWKKDNIPKVIINFCEIFKDNIKKILITTENINKIRKDICKIEFIPFVLIGKTI